MKRLIKPAIFIAIGLFIAFPLFSLSYYTMVRTTTPQFCAWCHEIQYAYNTWKTSTHVNNAQGFVADCMDCHLPAPHDTFDFFYAKTYHGGGTWYTLDLDYARIFRTLLEAGFTGYTSIEMEGAAANEQF